MAEPYDPPFSADWTHQSAVASRQTLQSETCTTLDDERPSVAEIDITYREKFKWKPPEGRTEKPTVPQWGIKGDFHLSVPAEDVEKDYAMVTVWELWDEKKAGKEKWTSGMMTVRPGTYAGYARERNTKEGPSIWVIWEWDSSSESWKKGAPSAKPGSTHRSEAIYIHIGNWPSNSQGCILVGTKATKLGVAHSTDAVWDILKAVGIEEDDWKDADDGTPGKRRPASTEDAKWFLIQVKDPNDVCGRQGAEQEEDPGKLEPDPDVEEVSPVAYA